MPSVAGHAERIIGVSLIAKQTWQRQGLKYLPHSSLCAFGENLQASSNWLCQDFCFNLLYLPCFDLGCAGLRDIIAQPESNFGWR